MLEKKNREPHTHTQNHDLALYGGSPHASGTHSPSEEIVRSAILAAASRSTSGRWRASGTKTTAIPAARAASTPAGASSKTRTRAGSTAAAAAPAAHLPAAVKKISGWGLPCVTWHPVMTWSKEAKKDALAYRSVGKNALAASVAQITRRCAILEEKLLAAAATTDALRSQLDDLSHENVQLMLKAESERVTFKSSLLEDRRSYEARMLEFDAILAAKNSEIQRLREGPGSIIR